MTDVQRVTSLQIQVRDLRRTIEEHQCGLCGDTSFQRTAIASIDYIDSLVASLAQKLPSQRGQSSVVVKSSYPGVSCFPVFQSQPLVAEDTTWRALPSNGTTGLLATFCNSVPKDFNAWREKRHSLGITSTDGIQVAFRNLVVPNGKPTPLSTPADPDAVIQQYAESTSGDSNWRHAGLSTMEDLVFLGECRVAIELGIGVEKVDEVIEQYLCSKMCPKTLHQYRDVPLKVSNWMGQLYDHCGCVGFELFLHADRTIPSYSALARSPDIKTAFLERVRPLIPTELCEKDAPPRLAFYLPFLVWASILLRLEEDRFDDVCRAFPTNKFEHSDFEQCLSFLSEGHPQVPRTPEQPACSDRTVEIDIASSKSTRRKRSASGIRKRNPGCPHTPPTCLPPESAVPHHMELQFRTGGSAYRSSDAQGLGHQRLNTVNVSHSEGGQQLPLRCDNIAHSSAHTAFSKHPTPCNHGSLSIGHGPPEQLMERPEFHYLPSYAQAAGDVEFSVARYGLGRPDVGLGDTMDIEFPGAAALAWTLEGIPNQDSVDTGALGMGAAVDTVWVEMNIGSGQIGGVRQCLTL
ncbi:hypothetical protein BDP55DRAFT_687882 [Colletotrichum godetiae]|uniref:Uncharacterized protein n=1 Tax=Colletotrichum godetiae TaxID=1209918 RepID=A0AAJ0A5D3_9PEZI|nr:uncharacterized protein BDP55DRAFT_687882 [Colletotrichum godetiae]KAK1656765.1 hypothetical protein BDP55DRAFT_687882 [Colletotrichum godetiae]